MNPIKKTEAQHVAGTQKQKSIQGVSKPLSTIIKLY